MLYLLLNYLFTYSATYSMEQGPSSEANWFSAGQEILRILLSPKVDYRIYRYRALVLILSQINPVRTPPPLLTLNPLSLELFQKFSAFC